MPMSKDMKRHSKLISGLCVSALGLSMFVTLALIKSQNASAQQPRPRPPIVIPVARPTISPRPNMRPRDTRVNPAPVVAAPMPPAASSATQASTPSRTIEMTRNSPTPAPEMTNPSAVTTNDAADQDSRGSIGVLRIDVPDKVEVGTPFDMDVWIDFNDPNYLGSVDVFMEQTKKVLYEPRKLQIKPGERSTIRVTIVKSPSGLAMIRASANGVAVLSEPIDA